MEQRVSHAGLQHAVYMCMLKLTSSMPACEVRVPSFSNILRSVRERLLGLYKIELTSATVTAGTFNINIVLPNVEANASGSVAACTVKTAHTPTSRVAICCRPSLRTLHAMSFQPTYYCQLCRAKLNLGPAPGEDGRTAGLYGNRIEESFIVLDDKRPGKACTSWQEQGCAHAHAP